MAPTPLPPLFGAEAAEPRSRRLLEPALLVLVALTLNLAGNGRVSLWDRDEPRYAGCVREMRARGDWIYPTFNAEPRYQKPILIYWLMRGGVALGGDNPFGARLVSAIAGACTCLLVRALGRRMLGPRAGMFAGFMLATAPLMVAESKLATTDATLALWLVAAQSCLWELAQRPSRALAAAFWVLAALATLTKGPVGLALIAASALASWSLGGPTEPWRRLHWRYGLAGFALLVAPWFIAVGIRSHGEFFRVALGQQVITRVTNGMEEHRGFPGYYLVTILGTLHPWSALLVPASHAAWARRKEHPAFGFLLGWAVGPLVLLECVRTKLVHYYLPAVPACVLLAAWLVVAVARDEINLRRWPLGRAGVGLLAGTAMVFTVTLLAGGIVFPVAARWPMIALALALAGGTFFALARIHQGVTERAVLALAATWAVVLLGAGAWLLPALEPYRTSRIVGERLAVLARTQHAQPALHSFQEPSIVYAYGGPLPLVRKWSQLDELVVRYGTLVTPLMPHELRVFRTWPTIDVELLEPLTGYNLSKGQPQPLQFVLIRESRLARSARLEKKSLVQ